MRLTMPQIIMLVHASQANKRRFEREYGMNEDDQAPSSPGQSRATADDIVYNGKALNQLTAQEYMEYMKV